MGSPSMPPDPNDPMMYGIGQRKNSFSGMDHLGPMGPVMGPVMDPIMQQGSPMNHSMPGHMGNMPSSHPGPMKGPQVSIQRAGNPEQFIPEMPAAVPNSFCKQTTSKLCTVHKEKTGRYGRIV
ncbi:hypothetical protein DPMN_008083 [Dreissena polymorpha]|uniref:Uncharacterized protein n=1 Tax=Dreissena polymorpha TaxID=45954 RepID=A0A9D4MXP7_DREPO|nr:hypothetical protein DPMN_008083 [Dreissena polymorpha]